MTFPSRAERRKSLDFLPTGRTWSRDKTQTAGRNIAQGPGYGNWDFSAFKRIPVTEGKEFQFRAEFFNLLNHTNFRLPDSDISSPTFNQILTALPPRLIQLAVKFEF